MDKVRNTSQHIIPHVTLRQASGAATKSFSTASMPWYRAVWGRSFVDSDLRHCVQCKCPHFVHWTDSGHSATCRKHPRTKITRGCAPNENANWFWCGDLSTSFGSGMIATLSLRLLLLQLPLHHCQTPRDFCDSKVGTLKASLRLLAAQDAPFIEKKLVWKHVVCIYVFIYLYFYIKKSW